MRWLGGRAARTAPSLGRIAQRSASVRLGARAQPMSARQNAKPSEQTARDLKFQNLRAFRCRDLPLCGSRFCRKNTAAAHRNCTPQAVLFALLSQRAVHFIMLRSKLALSATAPRGATSHAFCLKRQGLIVFIGNSVCVKLCAARFRRFRPRSVL